MIGPIGIISRRGPLIQPGLFGVFALLALGGVALAQEYKPPDSLFDPRLSELRAAALVWDARRPDRRIVDQVCLVPDLATYFETIAQWDGKHFFPILIDDGEYAPKFVRAFKPARVVRPPSRGKAVPPERLWEAALAAVGRAWVEDDAKAPSGGARPREEMVGPTPPGVVVSEPGSPSLAGAVALAAGRFQPLLKWTPRKRFAEAPTTDEAEALAGEIETIISQVIPTYARLGDACDFITLALDYPYRYQGPDPKVPGLSAGPAAFDDLIGRLPPEAPNKPRSRWAYTGRLIGDPVSSLYRAMCSLFLETNRAALFNGYSESDAMFGAYNQRFAEKALGKVLASVDLKAGPTDGTIWGWHQAFDPFNQAGLVMVNTSGGSAQFSLINGSSGQTADVPITVPSVVYMIHSFSAEDPNDPATLAGRWLANGAFLYFGSSHEPYLQSFRHPTTIAPLLAEGLPIAAALRMTPYEILPFGNPWRLVLLGDPLFRLGNPGRRVGAETFKATSSWSAYRFEAPPSPSTASVAKLAWAAKATLAAGLPQAPKNAKEGLAAVLLSVQREGLPADARGLYDALLTDALFQVNRLPELRGKLGLVPNDQRSPDLKRRLETARVVNLQSALVTDKWTDALACWEELMRSDSPHELKAQIMGRMTPHVANPPKSKEWESSLKSALNRVDPGTVGLIEAELKRLRESGASKTGR